MQEPTSWGVVETRSQCEARAEAAIRDLGYEPLVVRYNKLIRGRRIEADGRRVRSRQDTLVLRPFIPGYLFLPIPDGDSATLVDRADGVKRLFRNRDADGWLGRPQLIRARIVEQVIAAAKERDETPKPKEPKRPDLKAKLAAGETPQIRLPTGMIATLIELDDNGRARFFTEMLGGTITGSIATAEEIELVG